MVLCSLNYTLTQESVFTLHRKCLSSQLTMEYVPCRQTVEFLFEGQLTLLSTNKALSIMMNCPNSSAQKEAKWHVVFLKDPEI